MPTFQTFLLPDAGEGLTEAEIVQWHVAVGDSVEVNQTIVEIETAKSLVELPSPYTGVIAQIITPEGATVEVGAPIIVIDTDPDGASAPAPGTGQQTTAATSAPTSATPPAPSADSAEPATETAEESGGSESGAVLVGYGVSETPSARRTRRTDVPASAGSAPTPSAPAAAPPAPQQPARAATQSAAGASAAVPSITSNGAPAAPPVRETPPPAEPLSRGSRAGVFAKPPVRKLARDLGVNLASVAPTGPGEIITREDVLAYSSRAEGRALATYPGDDIPWLAAGTVSADGRQTRVPVKSVRKRTAEAMVASAFTAPHVTVFHTIDVTRTMKLVERLRADREFKDVRITPLLITAKALLIALNRHPEVNASWDENSQEIVYKHYVNLGIAANTPRGLVVPNIKDAHRLDLKELAQGLANLTETARAGKTSPSDMSDGTITITNVGVFGIDTGTPILNPGESAILAFGAIREQPWVHKGKIKKRWVTQLALSVDHRLVDGGLASRALADIAAVLNEPAQALVWG